MIKPRKKLAQARKATKKFARKIAKKAPTPRNLQGILATDIPTNDVELARHDFEIADQLSDEELSDIYVEATEKSCDPTSIREDIFAFAADAVDVKGNLFYGDPLNNFSAAAELKKIFWKWFAGAIKGSISPDNREKFLGRYTAHGHAIDMILTKLARIATCPTASVVEDCYIDGAAYFALAREVSERTAAREIREQPAAE